MRSALVALCLLLAGVIAVEAQRAAPAPVRAARQDPAPASVAVVGSRFAFADLEGYGAILERPPFHPSRRPALVQPKVAAAAAAPAAGQSELLLAGVLIMSDRKLALLQHAGSPDIIRLQLGAGLDDWVLMDVAQDRVMLRKGAQLRELRLHR